MTNIDAAKYLEENKGLIESLASKFYLDTSKFSRDDLVQEANLAAVRALNKFDPTKNKSKLSTYVYSAVHRSCRDFVRKNKHDLYKTGYHQTQDWKEAQRLENSDDEWAQPLHIDSPMAIRADVEISSPSGDGAVTIASTIPSGEPPPINKMLKQEQIDILKQEIAALPEREKEIISARFFDDKKLAEIAREQGVTRQRINQISKRAFNRLQEAMLDRLGYEILI